MKLAVIDGIRIDFAHGLNGLETEDSLYSAILISLLTDRRANIDDELPEGKTTGILPPDRRGWVGDFLSEIPNDRIGSRLYLLARRKAGTSGQSRIAEETRRDAITYAQEALQWLIDDGHATAVQVAAEWDISQGVIDRLNILVTVTPIEGDPVTYPKIPIGV